MNAITNKPDSLAPVVEREAAGQALARVILEGDLSKLSDGERVTHYNATCQTLGLNPLTRPFEYIRLNGKLVLYARKDATDQLRARDGVSISITDRTISGDLVIVTARATTRDGRSDEEIGAVPLGSLQGEAKANAIMKAITKAKRRVTLSICGLGFLDETEVESIRDVAAVVVPPEAPSEPEREAPFTLRFLRDQLSQFGHLDDIKGYLDQPKVKAAYWRAVSNGRGDAWAEIVQSEMRRVSPDAAEIEHTEEENAE